MVSAGSGHTLGSVEKIFQGYLKSFKNKSIWLVSGLRVKVSAAMRLSRIILSLLFACVVLFAQQGAVTHAMQHVLAEQTQDQSLPHDKLCDLCTVYAQIGSAIGSSPVFFAPDEQQGSFAQIFFSRFRSAFFAAFAARAPPYFV